MDNIPLTIAPVEELYVFTVPHAGNLGTTYDSYDNVSVKVFDTNMKEVEVNASDVQYFSTGKLGSLHGGLLNIDDARPVLSAEDIKQMQVTQFEHQVQKARSPSLIMCTYAILMKL